MLYSKENYETYFWIVKTLQGMDGNATYEIGRASCRERV